MRFTKVVKAEEDGYREGYGLMWKLTLACGHVLYRRRKWTDDKETPNIAAPKKLHCKRCTRDI